MKVHEIMSAPAITVGPDARVGAVADLMVKHQFSGVPVVDSSGALVGLISDKDVVAKHANVHIPFYLGILGGVLPIESRKDEEEMRRILAVTASDLMDRHPRVITSRSDVSDAADLMVDHDAIAVPVVDGGQLVGIVTRTDILQLVAREESE